MNIRTGETNAENRDVPLANRRPVLTVAIPTCNRAACLRDLLSLLAEQVRDEPRIELMISDNASSDETPAVVRDYVADGLSVRYIRNANNIGADANFLQCFQMARGKYVWLFSDDDLIIPGAIPKILSYCERAEYTLISLNAHGFEQSHKPAAAESHDDVIEISSPNIYASYVHVFFTFISGNIINKDAALPPESFSFSDLAGSSLIQLSWTYAALNRFSRGLYVREKLIAVRLNNTGGYNLFQVFGSTLAGITKSWLQSANVGHIVLNGTVQRFWPMMLLSYKKNPEVFLDRVKPHALLSPLFGGNLRYWIFAYPVIVLPRVLAKGWVFLTRVLNALDKTAGYPMLRWGVSAKER